MREVWDAMVAEFRRRSVQWVPKIARATVAAPGTITAQQAALGDGVRALLTELSELDPGEVHG